MAVQMTFRLAPKGHTVAIADESGVIYGGIDRYDPYIKPKIMKLLEIVAAAYAAGSQSGPDGIDVEFHLAKGRDADTGTRLWEVRDSQGNLHRATDRGILPFPGDEARKLLEIVRFAHGRGWERANDALLSDHSRL